MKTWQKTLIPTALSLAVGGGYLFFVFKARQDPGMAARNAAAQAKLSADDVAVVRMLFIQHFDDALALQNTSVWMKNGYTMPFYPFAGGQVQFGKRVGLIATAQRLDVKKIVKQAAPAREDDGIGHGTRQFFAVFALPGETGLFATPIGVVEGGDESFYCDLLFYYDDPHGIYDNWPKDVWAAIDAHQVKPGMSELETRMAIGQKMHADGQVEGDRTVTYDQAGKKWMVTFVKNRATVIRNEP